MTIDFSAHIISVSVSCIVHVHNVKYTRSRFILQCVVVSYNMSIDDLSDVYIPVTVMYRAAYRILGAQGTYKK